MGWVCAYPSFFVDPSHRVLGARSQGLQPIGGGVGVPAAVMTAGLRGGPLVSSTAGGPAMMVGGGHVGPIGLAGRGMMGMVAAGGAAGSGGLMMIGPGPQGGFGNPAMQASKMGSGITDETAKQWCVLFAGG
jgi:hypothetical protein